MEICGFSITWEQILFGIALTAVLSAASAVFTGFVLMKIPATYFCASRPRDFWIDQHPVIRWTGIVIKNVAGAFAVALGILLSLPGVPGPGLITILFGITLLDFPGKRKLERWLISRPPLLRSINRLRAKRGRPPLVLDDASAMSVAHINGA